MTQLGGHAMYLDWITTHLKKTALEDEIKCIARYADIIMARVYKHEDLITMAENSEVPVINALSDIYHPCQILADLMTIKEKKGKLEGLKLAYIGDGNNVCNSLILGCTKIGMKIAVACPKGYEPDKGVMEIGKRSGLFELTDDPKKAAENADVVYTDTWVSMGQESEKEKRLKIFKEFQVTKELLGDALFLHCLPAYRGLEVTDEVLDSKNSAVFDEAENRLHVQKVVMLKLLNKI
jgi:ornithine carbamoyltransferase